MRRKVNLILWPIFLKLTPRFRRCALAGFVCRAARHGERISTVISSSLPWILGFVLFLAGPLLVSLGLMFTEYAGFKKITYVGLANFEELIKV